MVDKLAGICYTLITLIRHLHKMEVNDIDSIRIEGACEGNLKNITLEIPKQKFVVITGVSGSGKSNLLIDVLFHECQRQYLEAMSMEGIHKPKVDRIRGVSPAILISQTDTNKNKRSTVGTVSDVYTDLRMVYEKLGVRKCPFCGEFISSAECLEETEKRGNDFYVYMYCCKCGRKMDKITRTHFSFNTREGACPSCEGLGKIHSIKKERIIQEELSLEEGAVSYWEKQYAVYQTGVLYAAFRHYGIPYAAGTPVREYSSVQKVILYEGIESDLIREAFPERAAPKTAALGRFEGVIPVLWRRLSEKNGNLANLEPYFEIMKCPDCKGERINKTARDVTVNATRLPQLSCLSIEKLYGWVGELHAALPSHEAVLVKAYLADIQTKLRRFLGVGLGYLSLDRQTVTLSGGELQRLRLAAVLDSDLTGIIYILDEPTAGLHPKDTKGLIEILRKLRDLGNSVLVIEHDLDMIGVADYIVDMGPGAGRFGGKVIAEGTPEEIGRNPASLTGHYLGMELPGKRDFRKAGVQLLRIDHAERYNLKDISVGIPTGCLTAIVGASGSGKSTLVFEVLSKGSSDMERNRVSGMEQFDRLVEVGQSAITKMRRSNVATYTEVYSEIRNVFAGTAEAKAGGMSAKNFSFNSPGGRCENCEGLGYIESNMLFFSNIEVECPVCRGKRFNREVLQVNYQGISIHNVLKLSVEEAAVFFAGKPKIQNILKLLLDVRLGYLELGQSLTTLSGGEGQRLKLARELNGKSSGQRNLFLLDEPTTGLHPKDVEHFQVLLDRMADAGNTIVIVEHNLQLIKNCDWVIELGPEGGEKGGEILFEGTLEEYAGK